MLLLPFHLAIGISNAGHRPCIAICRRGWQASALKRRFGESRSGVGCRVGKVQACCECCDLVLLFAFTP